MRLAVSAFFFALPIGAFANGVPDSFPLHISAVSVPSSVPTKSIATFVAGYEHGWVGELNTFSRDIDHQRTFLEDVASGDPFYLQAYFQGRDDADSLIRHMISTYGKNQTQKKLVEALQEAKVPNHSPDPTPSSVTPAAGQPSRHP